MATFKCVLIGDAKVGKTTFLKKLLTEEYNSEYKPTLGLEVHPLNFRTTGGEIIFNIWDTAGKKKFAGLDDGYYIQADCAIIMLNPKRIWRLAYWYRKLKRVCEKPIPIIIALTKIDKAKYIPEKMKNNQIRDFLSLLAIPNYNVLLVNTKEDKTELYLPFVYLARMLGFTLSSQIGYTTLDKIDNSE